MKVSLAVVVVVVVGLCGSQRTGLDTTFLDPLISVRKLFTNIELSSPRVTRTYKYNLENKKFQPKIPEEEPFLCDLSIGSRSSTPPDNVNELKPGDIDVIAALGDSITAANGALSSGLLHLFIENRGISWSIGGRDAWGKYLTIPNILKQYNPHLYGYSIGDGLTVERTSKFNVAEPMTYYQDLLYQARVLHKRMKNDKNVDWENHWKLLTIFVGNNDICSRVCEYKKPMKLVEDHEQHVRNTLRFLRDNIPRLIVNWVPIPNLVQLHHFKGIPTECYLAQRVECRCIYSAKITKRTLSIYTKIINKLTEKQREIVSSSEFDTDTFTVNFQPFSTNVTFPTKPDGSTDLRYYAHDCFHFSQLGHATAANALWNNMIQPLAEKQVDWYPVFQKFDCPSEYSPYLTTRTNSQ